MAKNHTKILIIFHIKIFSFIDLFIYLHIISLLVMMARDPVDLFLVPGKIILIFLSGNSFHLFLHLMSGLAFDRSGQRLGRGGG